MSLTDKHIIEALRSNRQTKAINELYKNRKKALSLLMSKGCTKTIAKDLFQEALIILIRKVNSDSFELNASLSTYLISICKNLWLNEQRKVRSTVQVDNQINLAEEIEINDLIKLEENYMAAENAFSLLGKKCKELLKLFYLDQLRMIDIARKLDFKSDKIAKNQKYKCLQKAHAFYLKHKKS